MTLFKRQVKVIIDTIDINDLDAEFSVTKSLQPEPNTAKIQIFNLNSKNRDSLNQKTSVQLEIHAGYEDETAGFGMIFRGFTKKLSSVLRPPDWITEAQADDGNVAQSPASRIAKSFSPGALFKTMIQDLANNVKDQQGIGLGNLVDALNGLAFKDNVTQAVKGAIIQGYPMKELQRLFRSGGLEFSIQNGEFQVLPIGQALAGTAQLVSPTTGLISSPESGKKGEVKFKTLMIPDIYPGRQVRLMSRNLEGNYRVEKATYSGSTFKPDQWYIEVEAKEL